jgi:transcriptional antiterminator NusG|tara:strand:+ start:791 stop:1261 length:471 start_codon:yes stop_codon:yes gene_type:complete
MSEESKTHIFALRTTANREDQVLDFVAANADRKGIKIYSLFRPHGLRGYIFIEAESRQSAEDGIAKVPYARGLLQKTLEYSEVESMLEQTKTEYNIKKNDVVEIITGPFKREKAKVVRIDQVKEEVIVELLEAAVPIPITVKLDSVRVIRREEKDE